MTKNDISSLLRECQIDSNVLCCTEGTVCVTVYLL